MERVRTTRASVLLVIDRLQLGGPGRVVSSLARGLRSRDVQAHVVHLGLGDFAQLEAELRKSDVPVWNLRLSNLLDPRTILRLAVYAQRNRLDIVHTHNRYANIVGRAAAAISRRPSITTVHNIAEIETGWRDAVRRRLDLGSARLLGSHVVTVSRAQRNAYQRSARLPAERISTVFNGIDTERFRPNPELRRSVRASMGVASDALVYANVAVQRPGKGLDDLLRSARLVADAEPSAKFWLVGDGPERERLEDERRRQGLVDSVAFLGSRWDVAPLLAAADVLVHPSHFEALPTSVMEAMASGLPVVATDVGGIPEIISSGRTGILVPPSDPAALMEALLRLRCYSTRSEMGAAARDWVLQHASLSRWLDAMQVVYDRVLRSSRRHPRSPESC